MESTEIELLQGIDTVIVRVSNIAASKKWYLEKLGLALLFEDDKIKLAVLDTKGPTSLTLWETLLVARIFWGGGNMLPILGWISYLY